MVKVCTAAEGVVCISLYVFNFSSAYLPNVFMGDKVVLLTEGRLLYFGLWCIG